MEKCGLSRLAHNQEIKGSNPFAAISRFGKGGESGDSLVNCNRLAGLFMRFMYANYSCRRPAE